MAVAGPPMSGGAQAAHASPPTTPTRMPRERSSRCSPTRTAAPTWRSCTPLATTSQRGRPPRRARLARRDPVPRAAVLAGAGVRRGGYCDEHAAARRRGADACAPGRRPRPDLVDGKGDPLDGRCSRHTSRPARGGNAGSSGSCGTARTAATCSTSPRPVSCPASHGSLSEGVALRGGCRGPVPQRHADQPHLDPHRNRPGSARRDGKRVLRPRDEGCGRRPQRRDHLAPQRPSGCIRRRAPSSRWSTTTSPRARAPAPPAWTRPSTAGPTTPTMQIIRASGNSRGAGGLATSCRTRTPRRSSATPPSSTTLLPVGRAGHDLACSRCSSCGRTLPQPPCSPGGPTW